MRLKSDRGAGIPQRRCGSRSFRGSQRGRHLFDRDIMAMHYWHGNAKTSRNRAVFTLNSLALPFRTQRPIEVWRSGSGGRSSYGNAGVWPHRHEAFGPGLRLRRGRRTNGSRRLARPGAHRGAGDRNYFDTAVQYGDGESEKNLGSVPKKLKPANVVVGTKVRLRPATPGLSS